MNESPKPDENLNLLKSAIQEKEQTIQKQQAKIQVLQESLITNQQTIRKLESTLADQNQRSSILQQKNQILQTNCDHLEAKLNFVKKTPISDDGELQKKRDNIANVKREFANLQTQLAMAGNEVKEAQAKEAELLAKVSELSNQKHMLEQENLELKQYQELAEEMKSQLDIARLQIQQLEAIHTKTQDSIGARDSELVKLRNINVNLIKKLEKVRNTNKVYEKEVNDLSARIQAIAVSTDQIDELQAKLAVKDQEIQFYKEKNKKLNSKIKKLKEKQNDKHAKSQIKRLQDKLKQKKNELSLQQKLLKEAQDQILNNQQNPNMNFQQGNNLNQINHCERNIDPLMKYNGNLIPREFYEKLKIKYNKLKKNKANSLEEIYTLKLAAARLEDDISMYENVINSLRAEREELKSKLYSAENCIDKYSKRANTAEQEIALLRDHMMTMNANQDELVALQNENNTLRKRMDKLEKDLIAYAERPKKTSPRMNTPRRSLYTK